MKIAETVEPDWKLRLRGEGSLQEISYFVLIWYLYFKITHFQPSDVKILGNKTPGGTPVNMLPGYIEYTNI